MVSQLSFNTYWILGRAPLHLQEPKLISLSPYTSLQGRIVAYSQPDWLPNTTEAEAHAALCEALVITEIRIASYSLAAGVSSGSVRL
ncbi:hypothetical protein N7453_002223 [Penicillium expansum]|nr:hypothetical protein N7453_002223 [Penicillium expansum]